MDWRSVDMSSEPHAAATTLFRLVEAGMRFRPHSKGVELMLPNEALSFTNVAGAHAEEITELLRVQVGGEVGRQLG
jgi:hypothetical protein